MCWVVCSQEGETNCRNKIPEYLLYRFSSCCCAKHVLVGSLHKQELVQSGAVCSFPWPCSGVLCVTLGRRQDTSGCNQSSVWLKYLGRDSRGRKSSPGCSALSQGLCHRVRRMVNSRAGAWWNVLGAASWVFSAASEKPYTEPKPYSPKCALCCLCA